MLATQGQVPLRIDIPGEGQAGLDALDGAWFLDQGGHGHPGTDPAITKIGGQLHALPQSPGITSLQVLAVEAAFAVVGTHHEGIHDPVVIGYALQGEAAILEMHVEHAAVDTRRIRGIDRSPIRIGEGFAAPQTAVHITAHGKLGGIPGLAIDDIPGLAGGLAVAASQQEADPRAALDVRPERHQPDHRQFSQATVHGASGSADDLDPLQLLHREAVPKGRVAVEQLVHLQTIPEHQHLALMGPKAPHRHSDHSIRVGSEIQTWNHPQQIHQIPGAAGQDLLPGDVADDSRALPQGHRMAAGHRHRRIEQRQQFLGRRVLSGQQQGRKEE